MRKPQQERLLLYFDILGFRELVAEGDPARVKKVLNTALAAVVKEQDRRIDLKTIYFSDTILLYHREPGFAELRLRALRHAANIVFRSLLGAGIPVSGVITYGTFTTSTSEDGKNQVYFGQALIDAYDCDKKEKWIGVLICPSVASQVSEKELAGRESEGAWIRRLQKKDLCLLLNPFKPLRDHFNDQQGTRRIRLFDPPVEKALNALAFLHETAESLARKGDFSSGLAIRYHTTLSFVRTMLAEECYAWAIDLVERRRK